MYSLPTGTVTFLFTDIEGSTRLAQQYPEQWETLRRRHHAILNESIEKFNGHVFQMIGDAFCAAFHTAPEALKAAALAQHLLHRGTWDPVPIKVRMGIHTGSAELTSDGSDYLGYTSLALTNRLMSAGSGGQILLSGATRELVRNALPENSELLDLGEKRLKDLLHPEHLSQLTIVDLPSTFPPLRTLEAYPNNLPIQLTTFIGREKEITEVIEKLAAHRLVTLTGSGGTGKTRLSLQVAAEVLEDFEHGTWFVEMASLVDPGLVPQTILAAIGINTQPGLSSMELLKEYLHDKRSLILLDNCEHLIEACANAANTLLAAAPELRILASSREALGVEGELSYPVPSLSLPDVKHLPAVDKLSQYEAVRLFIDRASLVSPNFTVDKVNAPYIAQICYRLDGIPLAIELAAARTRMMSLDQISERLDDRFRLLTGGARTALPRQQTLRATIDWSYDILAEAERTLLSRLSVFVGGWTLEAAEEVCAGDGIEHFEILDLLGQLVNKSLVGICESSSRGEMRYRMLETIRQYAREKLLESHTGESIRARHLAYFGKLAHQAGPELIHSHQVEWLNRLEDELDNLRAALEWALAGDVAAGLRIPVNTQPYWEARSKPSESSDWLGQLLDRYPAEDSLRAQALSIYAYWLVAEDKLIQANQAAGESLRISRLVGDRHSEATALLALGAIEALKGDMEKGMTMVEQSLALSREESNLLGQADALIWLSLNQTDNEKSRILVTEALQIARKMDFPAGIADCLTSLSQRAIWGGDFKTPTVWLEEALRLSRELGDKAGEGNALLTSALNAYWQRDFLRARSLSEKSVTLLEKAGIYVLSFWSRATLAYTLLRLGDLPGAKATFSRCIESSLKSGSKSGLAYSLEGVASLCLDQGQIQAAVRLFAWTDAVRAQINDTRPPVEQGSVTKDLGELRSRLGEAAFATLYAQGQAMTAEQAASLALEVLGR